MQDLHFDRQYQEGRAALNDGIDRLISRLVREGKEVFDALHRIQFSAPWIDPRSH